jgi:Cu/Ag efflux pump CusA
LSLVAAAVVLYFRGGTMNTMVIAGLVIAVGEVVDDAIIDVENINRRLRLNRLAGNPKSAFSVVLEASLEVRSAVVYASLIVALVFMPVFFLDGLSGTFFRPLALSYVLAIMASLFVALTVTPAMCLMLLRNATERNKEPPIVRGLKAIYRGILPVFVGRPIVATVILISAMAGAGVILPRLGEEFLPKFKERDFLMHWLEKPGTSVEAMTRATILASKELRTIPGVRNFGAHIGRTEVADEVVGPEFTELWISLDRDVDYDETVAKVQEVVDGYPGLYRDLLTYLKERIKEVLTGASATVVVRTFGPDLDVLREKADEIYASVKDIEGVADLKIEQLQLVPHVQVRFRPDAASNFGLTAGQVRLAATTLVSGATVGQVYDEQKVFDVVVTGAPEVRSSVHALRELLINTPGEVRCR